MIGDLVFMPELSSRDREKKQGKHGSYVIKINRDKAYEL